MRKTPSKPETTGRSETYKKVIGVLGIALATAGCNESAARTEKEKECRIIIEDGRTEIYCFLPEGTKKKEVPPKPLKKEEVEHAKSTRNEMQAPHVIGMRNYGGQFFKMARLPEMKEENPKARGKVYMRFPEQKPGQPRALVYFHGNGGQGYGYKNEVNVIKFSKAMQEAGDEVILISPEDGWGNFKPEETYKKKPGNWRDFNNPQTLANLISFAERMYGERIGHITLASFSGGNLGTKKSLRALEKVKDKDPEMASLYSRIQQIAYFDSATGSGAPYVARWLKSHPEAKLWSAFNYGSELYQNGNNVLIDALEKQGVDSRYHWEKMKWNEGHGIYEDYFKRFTAPQ